jgi:uncharacterized protein
MAIRTPCVNVCALSGVTGLCVGCARTIQEIGAWATLTDAERDAIMEVLPSRMEAAKTVETAGR